MVDGEEVEAEGAQRHVAAVADLVQLDLLELVLLELAFDQAERQLRPEHRHVACQGLQQVRQRARVVLVAVGDDDAAQLVLALHDVAEVGQDQVDPGVVVVGEHDAGVDDDHVVAVLENGHVLADAVKPTEGDDTKGALVL